MHGHDINPGPTSLFNMGKAEGSADSGLFMSASDEEINVVSTWSSSRLSSFSQPAL